MCISNWLLQDSRFRAGPPETPAAQVVHSLPMDDDPSLTALVRVPGEAPRTLPPDQLARIDELRAREGAVVWLDIRDPGDEQVALLRQEFEVHPLAEEDLQRRGQRPRIDTYPDQYVVIVYESLTAPPADDDTPSDAKREMVAPLTTRGRTPADPMRASPDLGEIHLFAGRGYLVSVHWGASPAIEALQRRFVRDTETRRTVGRLLYDLLDTIVDGYFPLLDDMAERIDDLEDRIVASTEVTTTLREILAVKRYLLELRRILAPQREVANSLLRRDVALVEDDVVPYYQDLYDHLVRILDQLDLYRDLVAAALDANLSVTSNNLNAVMKRLTAFTVVLMVPTLIAGIYGMNFRNMPELSWPLGYPVALVAMAGLMIGLAVFFWRKDWF